MSQTYPLDRVVQRIESIKEYKIDPKKQKIIIFDTKNGEILSKPPKFFFIKKS